MDGREFVTVVKATVREFGKDDVGNMAAALTYYVFFSLFPLIILVVSLARFFLNPEVITELIYNNITQALPGFRDFIQQAVEAAFEERATAGLLALVGFVTLVFSASGAFSALDKAINRAWNSEKIPGFFAARFTSFVMMLVLFGMMIISFIVTTVLTTGRKITERTLGEVPGVDIFWQLTSFAATVAGIFLIFVLMYRFLPRTDVALRDVWLGALMAALIWSMVKEIFAYYLGSNFANYDAIYGTLGTVVALLTWIYISSLIILGGAEFTAETARVRRLRAKAVVTQGPKGGTGSPWLPNTPDVAPK
jgi:membrane protein